MAAIALSVFAPVVQKAVCKPAPSPTQRIALIDKLCKTLGTQYRSL